MIVRPKIKGFICTTAHPLGCDAQVKEQIDYVSQLSQASTGRPRNVLVIGCSTGYGLASRILCAFGFRAHTLGIMFEKPPTDRRTASAGWYNTQAFERYAQQQGLSAHTLNVDAFSHQAKQQVIDYARQHMPGGIDLIVYSLASPRRTDPDTGEVYHSVLKPIGAPVTCKTLNTDTQVVHEVTLQPATEAEIVQTIKVMGGEDWELWIDALAQAQVLSEHVVTTAYTYIGKALTWPIYGDATIGKAKDDLDRAAQAINARLQQSYNGHAYVSVLKALVTQSSSAIPVMPLYISLLYQVMKRRGTHEGCIEQISRLMRDHLYADQPLSVDDQGRVRVDERELDDQVQAEIEGLWQQVTTDNVQTLADSAGYQQAFFNLFGFGFKQIDYDAEVELI